MAAVLDGWRGEVSFRELARRSGLSDVAVAEVLRGEVVPRPESVAALCSALGKTEAELLQAMAVVVH